MTKKEERTRIYASVPLGISKVSSFFGKPSPQSIENDIPYVKIQREHDEASLYIVVPKENIKDGISDQVLSGISKILSDPLQHRMVFTPFAFSDYQSGHYWFDSSDFCDFFGYQRDALGRHYTYNRKKIMQLHANLLQIRVEIPVIRGNKKILYEGKLIYSVDQQVTGYINDVEVFKKGRFGILPELWNDVRKYGYYAPLDERAFRINLNEYPWGFKIHSALIFEARKSWNKGVRDQGILNLNLFSFIDIAGIDVSPYLKHRKFSLLMERTVKELEYLKNCHRADKKNNLGGSEGLIGDYEIREEKLRVWLPGDIQSKLDSVKSTYVSESKPEATAALNSPIVRERVRHHMDRGILEGFYRELSQAGIKSRHVFITQLTTAALQHLWKEKREVLSMYGASSIDINELAQRISKSFPYNRGWGKRFVIEQIDSMIYLEILSNLQYKKETE